MILTLLKIIYNSLLLGKLVSGRSQAKALFWLTKGALSMTTSGAFKYATQCPVFARPSLLSQACVSQHVLSLLPVQGKVNAITLDSCTRAGLVFQDLVSSCEVVNCISVEVQSTGIMPTIAIDKTDGIAVRLDLMACSLNAVCKAGVLMQSRQILTLTLERFLLAHPGEAV